MCERESHAGHPHRPTGSTRTPPQSVGQVTTKQTSSVKTIHYVRTVPLMSCTLPHKPSAGGGWSPCLLIQEKNAEVDVSKFNSN